MTAQIVRYRVTQTSPIFRYSVRPGRGALAGTVVLTIVKMGKHGPKHHATFTSYVHPHETMQTAWQETLNLAFHLAEQGLVTP